MSALRVPPRSLAVQGVRAARWRLDPGMAHLTLASRRHGPLRLTQLSGYLADLRSQGFRGVVTAALAPADQAVFAGAGFHVVERLHLLRHDLDRPMRRGTTATRRARRRDRPAILSVDEAAFVPFWQLDEAMLTDALAATRTARLRVVDGPAGRVVAYAICGRSGARGYVQRLAVHPDLHGRGIGRSLLADGLAWLIRWGARDALVNTQLDNQRSLRLYQRAGFQLQPSGLAVMRLDFPSPEEPGRRRSRLGVLRSE